MMRPLASLLVLGAVAASGATIIDLQPARQTSTFHVRTGAGREGTAALINLNPAINAWFVVSVEWKDGAAELPWHLENPKPRDQRLLDDEKAPSGLVIAAGKDRFHCDIFGDLEQGRKSPLIYYPVCGGRLYLRNPAAGQRTALEAATEFLRNQVWGGENVIILFHHLLGDRYRETGESVNNAHARDSESTAGEPLPALTDPQQPVRTILAANFGIAPANPDAARAGMAAGSWYAVADSPGVFASVMQPNLIAPAIFRTCKNTVGNLDSKESSALVYLIAFDLDRYELAFALGTEFPGVGWSERVNQQLRDARLPGPDGIGNIAPLISTGLISPENGRRTVATFTGGFKRTHGAFRYGDLALKNHGSHYGFIENGVVFSRLQPGLATVFMRNDGSLDMKTWTEADNKLLPGIRYARQNGVPLIDGGIPGALVNRWGPGNWSGSEDEKLRTIRGGAALTIHNGKRFLIYAVFSDATPSAMARIFQAYQCPYAMLLDMNALEHTYFALYRRSGSEMSVDHLITGMSQLDKSAGGAIVPRFFGYPDNRDFFYVMRRDPKEVRP